MDWGILSRGNEKTSEDIFTMSPQAALAFTRRHVGTSAGTVEDGRP
jgi:hypothetical protein